MKTLVLALILSLSLAARAADNIKMNFANEEITKIIETYAKATGQKFIVDSTVRGKISIFSNDPMTPAEAFNELSTALAVNGFAIVTEGDTMVVKNARAAQRGLIPVVNECPELKPERLVTWVYTAKYISADTLMKDVRMFTSSYGEMSSSRQGNQLVLTDWTSSLNRVAAILKELDKPADPSAPKLATEAKKPAKK